MRERRTERMSIVVTDNYKHRIQGDLRLHITSSNSWWPPLKFCKIFKRFPSMFQDFIFILHIYLTPKIFKILFYNFSKLRLCFFTYCPFPKKKFSRPPLLLGDILTAKCLVVKILEKKTYGHFFQHVHDQSFSWWQYSLTWSVGQSL